MGLQYYISDFACFALSGIRC